MTMVGPLAVNFPSWHDGLEHSMPTTIGYSAYSICHTLQQPIYMEEFWLPAIIFHPLPLHHLNFT
jgi:hypothetical protein